MDQLNFLRKYFNDYRNLTLFDNKTLERIVKTKNILLKLKRDKKKALIFGNGGSAAIASHFSVDLTKNAKIRCTNYNESDLLTCFSNDYGYERWIEKSIDFFSDPGDVVILISSSGKSKNMLNGAKSAKKNRLSKIITLTGNKKNNPLSKLGDVNFWVNSKAYNHIENVHQLILLSLIDLTIGKSVYSV